MSVMQSYEEKLTGQYAQVSKERAEFRDEAANMLGSVVQTLDQDWGKNYKLEYKGSDSSYHNPYTSSEANHDFVIVEPEKFLGVPVDITRAAIRVVDDGRQAVQVRFPDLFGHINHGLYNLGLFGLGIYLGNKADGFNVEAYAVEGKEATLQGMKEPILAKFARAKVRGDFVP